MLPTCAGFSRDSSAPSLIIRDVTRAPVSHAFLIMDVPEMGGELVIEASIWGIRAIARETFEAENTIVATWSGPSLAPGLAEARRWLGEPYGIAKLLGMAVVYLGRLLRHRWRNPASRAHSMICSELVTRVLQASGVSAVADLDPASTSPEDLLVALQRGDAPRV